jgi:hypothetical protein
MTMAFVFIVGMLDLVLLVATGGTLGFWLFGGEITPESVQAFGVMWGAAIPLSAAAVVVVWIEYA